MNHYVYRIDRPSTGEWYVGIRSCKCAPLEDVGYMGSGVRIKASVRKHGRNQFTKTILVQVQTRKEAARIERGLVGPDQVADELCLNLIEGGDCGTLGLVHSEKSKVRMGDAARGRKHSPEVRQAISAAGIGRRHSPESLRKMSESLKGREVSDTTRRKLREANLGKKLSSETRVRMSAAHSGRTHSESTKERIRRANKGRKFTDEHRAALRAAHARRKKKD